MYVCVCKAVTDSRIRRSVGAGACSIRDLARECGLGTACGKCVPLAREVLSEAIAAQGPAMFAAMAAPAGNARQRLNAALESHAKFV